MNINLVTVILGLALSISGSTLVASGPGSNFQVFAQSGNDTSTASTGILTNGTEPVAEKLTTTPGEKTFHIFT